MSAAYSDVGVNSPPVPPPRPNVFRKVSSAQDDSDDGVDDYIEPVVPWFGSSNSAPPPLPPSPSTTSVSQPMYPPPSYPPPPPGTITASKPPPPVSTKPYPVSSNKPPPISKKPRPISGKPHLRAGHDKTITKQMSAPPVASKPKPPPPNSARPISPRPLARSPSSSDDNYSSIDDPVFPAPPISPRPPPPLPPGHPSHSDPQSSILCPHELLYDSDAPLFLPPSHSSLSDLKSKPLSPKELVFEPPPLPPSHPSLDDPRSKPLSPKELANEPPPLPPAHPLDDDDDNYTPIDYDSPVNFAGNAPHNEQGESGMGLVKFTNQYQSKFPVLMEVTRGFLNNGEDCSMTEGERFLVHFVKKTRVVTMRDEQREQHKLPLNSIFEFGLLYDPNNNPKEALSGFVFKTAGDIMIARKLPNVVRARKSFRGISPEHSVEVNDLLLVKETVRKKGERPYLRCFRASNGDERHLHDNTAGHFSTNPYDVRMILSDVVKHFQLPFNAVFYINTDIEEDIPSHLVSSIVHLSSPRTEVSLITTVIEECDDNESDFVLPLAESDLQHINEIPLTYNIRVCHLPLSSEHAEQVLLTTENVYKNFEPSGVYPYLPKYTSTQFLLWKAVRTDLPLTGVQLVSPPFMNKQQELAQQSPQSSGDNIEEIVRLQIRLARLEADHVRLLDQNDQNKANPPKNVYRIPDSTTHLTNELNTLKQEVKSIQQQLADLVHSVAGE